MSRHKEFETDMFSMDALGDESSTTDVGWTSIDSGAMTETKREESFKKRFCKLGNKVVSVVLTIALATTMTPSEAYANIANNGATSANTQSEDTQADANNNEASDDSAISPAEDENAVDSEDNTETDSPAVEESQVETQADESSEQESTPVVQAQVPDDNIATGVSGTVTWYITADGVLTFVPTAGEDGSVPESGTFDSWSHTSYSRNPWNAYADKITAVNASGRGADQYAAIDDSHPKRTIYIDSYQNLFANLWKLKATADDYEKAETSDAGTKKTNFDVSGLAIKEGVESASIKNFIKSSDGIEVVDLKGLNTSHVTEWDEAFANSSYLRKVVFDTDENNKQGEDATMTQSMFKNCGELREADLSHFYGTKVTSASNMFNGSPKVERIDLTGFGNGETTFTSITNIANIFNGAGSLSDLRMPVWSDSVSISSMFGAFVGTGSLTSLDMSRMNFSAYTSTVKTTAFSNSGIIEVKLPGKARFANSIVGAYTPVDYMDFPLASGKIWTNVDTNDFYTSTSDMLKAQLQNDDAQTYKISGKNVAALSISYTSMDTDRERYFTITDGSTILRSGADYTVEYGQPDDNGLVIAKITGIGTYSGETTRAYHVSANTPYNGGGSIGNVRWGIERIPGQYAALSGNAENSSYDMKLYVWPQSGVEDEMGVGNAENTYNKAWWGGVSNSVLSSVCVEKSVIAPANLTGFLSFASNLYQADLRGLKITSKTTNMYHFMREAKMVDLKGTVPSEFSEPDGTGPEGSWDLSKVSNLNNLFYSCTRLQDLNTTNWDLSSVTTMTETFSGCTSLKKLDTSNWSAPNLTAFQYTFANCSSLESVDLSSFNTNKVTTLDSLFFGCSAMKEIRLQGLTDENVTNWRNMFYGCTNLEYLDASGIKGLKYGNSSSSTRVENVFYNCPKLNKITLPANANRYIFCSTTSSSGGTAFGTRKTGEVWVSENTGQRVDGSSVDMIAVQASAAAADTWEIKGNTIKEASAVTYTPMVDGSNGVANNFTVTVNSRTLQQGTDFEVAYGTPSDTGLVEATLTGIGAYTGSISRFFHVSNGAPKAAGTLPTQSTAWGVDVDGNLYVWPTDGKAGTLNNWGDSGSPAWYANGKDVATTFKIEGSITTLNMRQFIYQFTKLKSFDLRGLDTSSVINFDYAFSGNTALETIDVSTVDTSKASQLRWMFQNDTSLKSADLSSFDTSGLWSIWMLFDGCTSLESVDVSSFNTSKVREFAYIFRNCTSLKSVDVSNFDLTSATNLNEIFYNSGIEELDLSTWVPTSALTRVTSAFRGMTNLKRLDLSNFYCKNITEYTTVFTDTTNIERIILPGSDKLNSNLGSGWRDLSGGEIWKYVGCGTSYWDVSSNVWSRQADTGETREWYISHLALTGSTIYLQSFTPMATTTERSFTLKNNTRGQNLVKSTDGVTGDYTLEYHDDDDPDRAARGYRYALLKGINTYSGERRIYFHVSESNPVASGNWYNSYDTSGRDAGAWGIDSNGVLSLWCIAGDSWTGHLYDWNSRGSGSTTAVPWDSYRAYVTEVHVDNKVKLYDGAWLFYNFSACTVFDINKLDVRANTSLYYALKALYSPIDVLDVSEWDTRNVTSFNSCFEGSTGVKTIKFGENWSVSKTTDLSFFFNGCTGLEELDLSMWNTSNATTMRYMFNNCTNLTKLNVKGFNTTKVSNMERMFYNCATLTELDLSSFYTPYVTDVNYMFAYCSALRTLNISSLRLDYLHYTIGTSSNFGTTKWNQFINSCTNLETIYLPIAYQDYGSTYYYNNTRYNMPVYYNGNSRDGYYCALYAGNSSNPYGANYRWRLRETGGSNFDSYYTSYLSAIQAWCGTTRGYTMTLTREKVNISNTYINSMTPMGSSKERSFSLYDYTNGRTLTKDTDYIVDYSEPNERGLVTATCTGIGAYTGTIPVKYHYDPNFSSTTGYSGSMVTASNYNYTAWGIDHNGNLYVWLPKGTGSVYLNNAATYTTYQNFPWYTQAAKVVTATIEGNTYAYTHQNMFNYSSYSKLKSVEFLGTISSGQTTAYSFEGMFYGRSTLESVTFNGGTNFGVTSFANMFYGCTKLTNIEGLDLLNTSSLTTMSQTFRGCQSMKRYDLSGINTSNVTSLYCTFYGNQSVESIKVNNWDTSKVTDMRFTFAATGASTAPPLQTLDLSSWTTTSLQYCAQMFEGLNFLTELNIGKMTFNSVNTSTNSNYYYMFRYVNSGGYNSRAPEGWNNEGLRITLAPGFKVGSISDRGNTNLYFTSFTYKESKDSWNNSGFTDSINNDVWCYKAGYTNLGFDTSTFNPRVYKAWIQEDTGEEFVYGTGFKSVLERASQAGTKPRTFYMSENLDINNIYDVKVELDAPMGTASTGRIKKVTDERYPEYDTKAGVGSVLAPDTSKKIADYTTLKESTDGGVTGDYTVTYEPFVDADGNAMTNSAGIGQWKATIKGINNYTGERVVTYHVTADTPVYAGGETQGSLASFAVKDYQVVDVYKASYWGIDDGGNMIVWPKDGISGSLIYWNSKQLQDIPWRAQVSLVKTVRFEQSVTSYGMREMFSGMVNLEWADLTGLRFEYGDRNSSRVFMNCPKLTDVYLNDEDRGSSYPTTVAGWPAVTPHKGFTFDLEMIWFLGRWFEGCSSLKNVNLTKLNTAGITNFDYMFSGCTSLETVDISNFNTTNGTLFGYMFDGCSSLKSIDLTGFNMNNATDMSYMFRGCTSLTELDLSTWSGGKVTNTSYMFNGMTSLKKLNIGSMSFAANTTRTAMFTGSNALTEITLPRNTTNMQTCLGTLYTIPTNKRWKCEETGLAYQTSAAMAAAQASSANPRTYKLTDADFSKAQITYSAGGNTLEDRPFTVTCDGVSLTQGGPLDADGDGVQDTDPDTGEKLWTGDYYVTVEEDDTVDSSGNKVNPGLYKAHLIGVNGYVGEHMRYMHYAEGTWIQSISVTPTTTAAYCIDPDGTMFIFATNSDGNVVTEAEAEANGWTEGAPEGTFTAYGTNTSNGGTNWYTRRTQVKKLDINGVVHFPNMQAIFANMTALTDIDLDGMDITGASNTNATYAFAYTSVDTIKFVGATTSKFSLKNITDIGAFMFANTSSATSTVSDIDISSWVNTERITNAQNAFSYNKYLTNFNFGEVNFNALTNASYMFQYSGAKAYTENGTKMSVNIKDASFSALQNASYMFYRSALGTLDWSTLNSNLTSTESMFYALKGSDETDNMRNCLESVDLSGLVKNGGSTLNMQQMFYCAQALESVKLTNFIGSAVTNTYYMFAACSSLKTVDMKKFDGRNDVDACGMFNTCTSLEAIELPVMLTTSLYLFSYFAYNCTSLKVLDLGSATFANSSIGGSSSYYYGSFSNTDSLEQITLAANVNSSFLSTYSQQSSGATGEKPGFRYSVGRSGTADQGLRWRDSTGRISSYSYWTSSYRGGLVYNKYNYMNSSKVTFTLEKCDVAEESNASAYWRGNKNGFQIAYNPASTTLTPTFTVTDVNNCTLTAGTDYEISEAEVVDADTGLYRVHLTFKEGGNYVGEGITRYFHYDANGFTATCGTSNTSSNTYAAWLVTKAGTLYVFPTGAGGEVSAETAAENGFNPKLYNVKNKDGEDGVTPYGNVVAWSGSGRPEYLGGRLSRCLRRNPGNPTPQNQTKSAQFCPKMRKPTNTHQHPPTPINISLLKIRQNQPNSVRK